MVIPLRESSASIIEIKIGAGPIGEVYMNNNEEVRPKGETEEKMSILLKCVNTNIQISAYLKYTAQ